MRIVIQDSAKPVYVRPYIRCQDGGWQDIPAHFRRRRRWFRRPPESLK